RWCVAEVTPPVDDLFWRAAADPELEPPVGDQIGRAGVLGHVERVFVPHVDDSGPDLNAACLGADRCEQWERRRELPSKMVDEKVGPVRAELLRRYGQLNRLLEDIARRPRRRLMRCVPVTER